MFKPLINKWGKIWKSSFPPTCQQYIKSIPIKTLTWMLEYTSLAHFLSLVLVLTSGNEVPLVFVEAKKIICVELLHIFLSIKFPGNHNIKFELTIWVLQELPLIGQCEYSEEFGQLN